MPTELQLELIDLQVNGFLKEKGGEGKLVEFYRCRTDGEFLKLKKFASGMAPMFRTAYVCEQTFLKLKYPKSKHQRQLTHEHSMVISLLRCSNSKPNIDVS